MNKTISILPILLMIILLGCKKDRKFTEVKNLSEFQNTKFVPTLEYQISDDENAVYAAALLFAWDEVRNLIDGSLSISADYPDLQLLNQSPSFKNVLKKGEYSAYGEIEGDKITTKAEFKKSLPFEVKLKSFDNKLVFNGTKVPSFGLSGYTEHEQRQTLRIVYYKNDNNFIIKLFPKDKEHEIILFKTDQKFNSMSKMIEEIEVLAEIGESERMDENQRWKYYYKDEDEVIIPKFNFNIETNYRTLEGSNFSVNDRILQIETAWQRTAFILDEIGAEVESEAMVEAVEAIEEDYEEPKPKKMIFDKPFLILLKRTDSKNPYFGMWTVNTELMSGSS